MEQTLEAGDLVQIRDGFNRPPIYPYDEYGIFIKWGSAEKYGAKLKVFFKHLTTLTGRLRRLIKINNL